MKTNFRLFISELYKINKFKICFAAIFVIVVTITELYSPLLIKNIIDKGIGNKEISILTKCITLYLVINLLNVLADFILGYLYSNMRNRMGFNLRVKLLEHLSTLSGKNYVEKKTGNILSIVQSDIDIIESIDSKLFFDLVKNIIIAMSSVYFMIILQVDLFVFVLISQAILFIAQRVFTKKIHENVMDIREEYGKVSNVVQEYILNIMNIVITNSKSFFIKEYKRRETKLIAKEIKTDLLYNGNISLAMFINLLVTIFIYGYGGYKIIIGRLTLGELMAFQSYSAMLMGPCLVIINSANRIQQARVSIDRVYKLLGEKSDIIEIKDKKELNDDIRKIEFSKVGFSYTKEEANINIVLSNINMIFKKGTTAIVGESGCGKSTIISLIYRLWDVAEGSIKIDDEDIQNLSLESLRNSISVVTQDSLIFDKSIRDNICLGKEIDEEKLLDVCERVGLMEYISKLEKGLDTEIGERGIKISGGQKQKISIARAVMQDSKILILDEATSALDNISQNNIIKNLNIYIKEKIVIVIAHRLSTIKDVDNIYVIKSGEIEEYGNHEKLIREDGYYASLYKNE